jgi:hypothetical protein
MRQLLVVLLACASALAGQVFAEDSPEKIPPAFRSERHFSAGASYLRQMGPGWTVRVERADGSTLELAVGEDGLELELPAARMESDREVVTPLGYRLRVGEDLPSYVPEYFLAIEVEAPNGKLSYLYDLGRSVLVLELDGRWWESKRRETSWRFPDGSRLDEVSAYGQWELTTIHGERFRLDTSSLTWEQLPSLTTSLLINEMSVPVLQGNGDDWLYPSGEDHVVYRWSWYPGSLGVEEVIESVESGARRGDLDLLFNELERVQRPADMAAYLLGRRLALSGGDTVTFVPPDGDPVTAYLLPGPSDPETRLPAPYDPSDRMRLR